MYLGDTYIIYRDTCRYGPRSKKEKNMDWKKWLMTTTIRNTHHAATNFLNLIQVLLGENVWIHVLHIYLHLPQNSTILVYNQFQGSYGFGAAFWIFVLELLDATSMTGKKNKSQVPFTLQSRGPYCDVPGS